MGTDDVYTRQDFVVRQYAKGVPAAYIEGFSKTAFLNNPDKIEYVSANEIHAYYGNYKQIITAEGTGNERHNFKSTIEKIEG